MVECSFTNNVVVGSTPVGVSSTSDIAPVSSKEFLDIQAIIVWIHSERRTCHDQNIQSSQMHHTDKYLQYSSIIWSAWLNV